MKKRVIIVGAGISGLSIANMLSEKFDVQILEKEDKPGGLIKCERINGNLFHKVGGHVFNSKDQKVLNWFWQKFNRNTEFLKTKRNAKIYLNNNLIGYPIENFLYQLPERSIEAIVGELIELATTEKKEVSDYNNFRDFLIGNFGKYLYELYFGPYNTKMWNRDLSDVPLKWLEGKLPMPKINEIITCNIQKKEESEMVHSSFYYPLRDGSQFIINKLAEQQNVTVSYIVSKIQLTKNGKLSINNGNVITDVLIYTGDIRQLFSIVDINDKRLEKSLISVMELSSNGTSNVLCETDENDISWLYLPEKKYKAHRIIYTGKFSDTNNEGTNRKTCVVEFSGKHEKSEMRSELQNLPGNLRPLAFNYEPNSYVIQDKQTRRKIGHLKSILKEYNIYLLGRFAEWEYYNMDKCIGGAMELSNRLIKKTK